MVVRAERSMLNMMKMADVEVDIPIVSLEPSRIVSPSR